MVHCAQGKSRSPALAAAFMIAVDKFTAKDALKVIKSRRKMASPNKSFQEQLRSMEIKGELDMELTDVRVNLT